MAEKSRVEVVIGGKVFLMSGYESETHIQKVASHINRKLQEFEGMDEYRSLPADMKPILVEINIADELMKARIQIEQLEADLRLRENELAEVKQELVSAQMSLERLERNKKK